MYSGVRGGAARSGYIRSRREGKGGERVVDKEGKPRPVPRPICVFQPIVDVVTGRVLGYEALARLPGREAEGFSAVVAGLSQRDVQSVLLAAQEEALRIGASRPAGTLLFLNVTPRLIHALSGPLVDAAKRPGGLVLELPETIGNRADWAALLAGARSRGMEVALDDFGVGIQDLDRLVSLNPEWVKLDIRFVSQLTDNVLVERVTEFLIRYSGAEGIRFIAEGVERIETMETLRRLGVRYMQGHLLAYPGYGWVDTIKPVARPALLTVDDPHLRSLVRMAGVTENGLGTIQRIAPQVANAVSRSVLGLARWLQDTPAGSLIETFSNYSVHRQAVHTHIEALLTGTLTEADLVRSRSVAHAHQRLQVPLPWYQLTYAHLRDLIHKNLVEQGYPEAGEAAVRLINLDIANLLDVYQTQLDYDVLTTVLTRRAFFDRGEHLVARALREGRQMAFILFDLDGFKRINDAEGHIAGDSVLQNVGRVLAREIDRERIAGRIGGDEFALLVPHNGRDATEALVTRLKHGIGGADARIGVSSGTAVLGEDGMSLAALYASADVELYRIRGRRQPS